MSGYIIFMGGIISGTLIYLIKEYKRKQKNRVEETSKIIPVRKENLNDTNLKNFQNLDITSELVKNEVPYDPIINGDFLTEDILDQKFKNIATYNLGLIEQKNSQENLYKIKFKKLNRLIDTIHLYEPKYKSRDDKKLLIQYLKQINKPIDTISYKVLLELERDYLFPIIDKKDEYGWKYKNAWLLGLFPTVLIEILFWFLIKLILTSFINFQFYYIPIFTTYYLINRFLIQHKKRKEGKLW